MNDEREPQDEPFVPLGVREGTREFGPLSEQFPPWLVPAMIAWLDDLHRALGQDLVSDSETIMRKAALELQMALPGSLQTLSLNLEKPYVPEVIDYLLWALEDTLRSVTTHMDLVVNLSEILEKGGSAWQVTAVNGRGRLTRRVPSEITEARSMTMKPTDRAAEHLKIAWASIYGVKPDAGKSYLESVKAVEAIARPIISPKDQKATLGKMIEAMRDKPSKWTVEIEHHNDEHQVRLLSGMMELLWKGQFDRHGDESKPIQVGQEQAEAAVHLAATLVQWFRTGVVKVV